MEYKEYQTQYPLFITVQNELEGWTNVVRFSIEAEIVENQELLLDPMVALLEELQGFESSPMDDREAEFQRWWDAELKYRYEKIQITLTDKLTQDYAVVEEKALRIQEAAVAIRTQILQNKTALPYVTDSWLLQSLDMLAAVDIANSPNIFAEYCDMANLLLIISTMDHMLILKTLVRARQQQQQQVLTAEPKTATVVNLFDRKKKI